jgi:hypothetical protein
MKWQFSDQLFVFFKKLMTLVIYENWVFELFLRIMIMNSRKRPDNCWGLLPVAGSSYRPTLIVNPNWTKWRES